MIIVVMSETLIMRCDWIDSPGKAEEVAEKPHASKFISSKKPIAEARWLQSLFICKEKEWRGKSVKFILERTENGNTIHLERNSIESSVLANESSVRKLRK